MASCASDESPEVGSSNNADDTTGLEDNQSGTNFGSGKTSGKSDKESTTKGEGSKPNPNPPAGYQKKEDRASGSKPKPTTDPSPKAGAGANSPTSANKDLPEDAYPQAGGPLPADSTEVKNIRHYKESYMEDRAIFQSPSGNIKCAIGATYAGCGIPSYRDTKPYGYSKVTGADWWINFKKWELIARDDVPPYMPDQGGSSIEEVPYGKTVHYAGYACHSERNGMTCWDPKSGKGVFMNTSSTEFFG